MRQKLASGLIVSCQAVEGEPLYNCGIMHYMARAAVEGGAKGIRAICDDIPMIKKEVAVPIIGLCKTVYQGSSIYITPTIKELVLVAESSADIVAIDATDRVRPKESIDQIVEYAKKHYPDLYLMADISTFDEAKNAARLGFDYISTTLRGYTEKTKNIAIPDIDFIKRLVEAFDIPVVAEGGIWTLEQAEEVVATGAKAMVIGTAITRPRDITRRFNSVFKQ